jgi:hypothetical protein
VFRAITAALCLLPAMAAADDLWLSGGLSQGPANGNRVAVTRTLGNFGLDGVRAGVSHSRVGDSWWTLIEGGINRRLGNSLIASGSASIGPGQIDGRNFSTRKLVLGATWLVDRTWSIDVGDTYLNVDGAIGHILNTGVTRTGESGVSIALNAMRSVGSDIDTQQLGARFNWPGDISWMGGVYVGETSNPLTLGEFGEQFGGRTVRTRQAYAGASKQLGRYTLLATFDVLRIDGNSRRELAVVLKVPLGKSGSTRQ